MFVLIHVMIKNCYINKKTYRFFFVGFIISVTKEKEETYSFSKHV